MIDLYFRQLSLPKPGDTHTVDVQVWETRDLAKDSRIFIQENHLSPPCHLHFQKTWGNMRTVLWKTLERNIGLGSKTLPYNWKQLPFLWRQGEGSSDTKALSLWPLINPHKLLQLCSFFFFFPRLFWLCWVPCNFRGISETVYQFLQRSQLSF